MKKIRHLLESIAKSENYKYLTGEQHWQNLLDAEDDLDMPFDQKKKYLIFITENYTGDLSKFGGLDRASREGVFMIAVRSSMADPSFEYKQKNHFDPLEDLIEEHINNDFRCLDDLLLRSFRIMTWHENYLDTNLDCVEVRVRLDKKW